MNIDFLASFYTIAKEKSISKAARVLHVTQPGLSLQLKSLEDELEATLVQRSNRGIQLTDQGEIVFKYAQSILALEKNMLEDLKETAKDNTLSICSCHCLGSTKLPSAIYQFTKEADGLKISLEVDASDTAVNRVQNHDFNIGIATSESSEPDFAGLHSDLIMQDRLAFVTNPSSEVDQVDIQEIGSLPLYLRNKDSNLSRVLQRELNKNNLSFDDLNIAVKSNSSESIKSSIIISGGYAFLPSVIVEAELKAGLLKEVDIGHFDPHFYYHFIYRNNYKLSNQESSFRDYLLTQFPQKLGK